MNHEKKKNEPSPTIPGISVLKKDALPLDEVVDLLAELDESSDRGTGSGNSVVGRAKF
jgi:hypothetical protein